MRASVLLAGTPVNIETAIGSAIFSGFFYALFCGFGIGGHFLCCPFSGSLGAF